MDRFLKTRYTDNELPDLVRELNLTYDDIFQWKKRRAKKEHTGLFGKIIEPGEYYWRMRMGGSYSNDLKLSNSSMERFLFVLFAPYPKWEGMFERENTKKITDIRVLLDKLDRQRERLR